MLPFLYEKKEKENKDYLERLYIEDYVPEQITKKDDKDSNKKDKRGVVIIQM